ncbi:hypothetical protein AALA98_14615 [Lachnospiraceae bacterium 45-W7]
MRFPYGKNRKIMEEEYNELAIICRKENKPEEMIEQIHDLLLHQLNRDRAYITHTQPYECYDSSNNKGNRNNYAQNRKRPEAGDSDIIDEGQSPLLKKFSAQLSVTQGEICEWGRMDWIEDLDTVEIIVWIKKQSKKDIELLTLLSVDGLKQKEVAEIWGVSDAAISKRMRKIRESLAKVLP